MIDDLATATGLLRDHGPWFLVVVAGLVIWRMAHYIQTMQDRHHETVRTLLQDHNKEQKEETKQLVSAMLSTEQALQSINNTLNAIGNRRP